MGQRILAANQSLPLVQSNARTSVYASSVQVVLLAELKENTESPSRLRTLQYLPLTAGFFSATHQAVGALPH